MDKLSVRYRARKETPLNPTDAIRRTTDRGVILLIDDRFSEPVYRRLLSDSFRRLRYIGNGEALSHFFSAFWNEG